MIPIKTQYDLKTALKQIVEAIEEKDQFFTNATEEEKHNIEWFRKSLEKRRNEMKAAVAEHYESLEREVYPLLDKVATLRDKLTPVDMNGLQKAIPQVWQLRDLISLVETMDRLKSLPQESWDRLGQLAAIAANNSETK
jgi:predicted  nucleic acid-binding Zn-ribbon protein